MTERVQCTEVSTMDDLLVRAAVRHPAQDALVFLRSRHTSATKSSIRSSRPRARVAVLVLVMARG
ncbi:hypothetical protein [Streptomyces cucumeris]|uniref:hypothetical protein n=1 Tax=Streptomyces cucumeris TaxID=2962890 RepID=UPI003D73DF7C